MQSSLPPNILVVLVGLATILFIALFLRFFGRVEGGFSFFNKIKLWFKGANSKQPAPGATTGVSFERDSIVVAHDVVGGDKIVNVHAPAAFPTSPLPAPALSLKVLRRDSARALSNDITVERNSIGEFGFGFALVNSAPGIPASNIRITVDVYWDGSDLQSAPKFRTREMARGWTSGRGSISNDLPAVFNFHGPTFTSFPSQPEEWLNFSGEIEAAAKGRFTLSYLISSASPPSECRGNLSIALA